MPDYSSLMGMLGLGAGTLPEYFGQYFEDVDPRWSQYMGEQFGAAETALGELPGLRRGMLGQLRGGLQERGVAAGRGMQARRAGAGFAGAGALDRMGRTARRGIEQEYGRGMYGIGQDIARKEAGVLGGLRGQLGGFLEMLMAADTRVAPAGDTGGLTLPGEGWEDLPTDPTLDTDPSILDIREGEDLPQGYMDWLAQAGWEDTPARRREYQSFLDWQG